MVVFATQFHGAPVGNVPSVKPAGSVPVTIIVPLFAGRITCGGTDLARRKPWQIARAGVGYVPQLENVFTGMTVAAGDSPEPAVSS